MRPVSRDQIKQIVVILAGSRTGSSFLFRALKTHGEFLAPTGEETPFYRQAGLGVFHAQRYSDAIVAPPSDTVLEKAAAALLQDVGIVTSFCESPERLASQFLTRLELQWPESCKGAQKADLQQALVSKFKLLGRVPQNWSLIYKEWVKELQAAGLPVNPDLFSPKGPHPLQLPLLEEPPYICPEPKQPLTEECAANLPLLLKTSTNVYRIPFLRSLFPHAKFRWVLLHRNPAATISALIDGWLSSGFHSHDVHPAHLAIKGYSDSIPGGKRFWKFDMPEGWEAYRNSTLPEVCAFQWLAAHREIEKISKNSKEPVFSIAYEDMLEPEKQSTLIQELISFAGTSTRDPALWNSQEPVAAVSKPSAGKWRKREAEIVSLMRSDGHRSLMELAGRFDYDPSRIEDWP